MVGLNLPILNLSKQENAHKGFFLAIHGQKLPDYLRKGVETPGDRQTGSMWQLLKRMLIFPPSLNLSKQENACKA
jgi:hypothetical protein